MRLTKSPTLLLVMPLMLTGGAERLLSGLVEFLINHQWRVVVISTEHQGPHLTSSLKWFSKSAPEVYMLDNFLSEDEKKNFIEYLIQSKKPDCILNAGSNLFYEMLPYIHEGNPRLAFVDLLFNTVVHTAMHQKHRLFYSFALAENDEVFNWYKEIGWDSSRCRKVASGVDIKLYKNEKKPLNLMSQYGLTQEDIVVGYSGRLSPEKDPMAFVEIARLCEGIKNLHFIMTGDGPMEGKVRKAVQQLPPSIRFSYIGVVDEIAPFFSLYDVVIIPSIIDGRPMAALEALASGTAVIASRVGGLPELIFDGFNGYLCEPGKPLDFASRIKMLLQSKGELSRLKKNAREFAEGNLDSTKSFVMYEKALLDAINLKHEQYPT